jgi:hypothetical protein
VNCILTAGQNFENNNSGGLVLLVNKLLEVLMKNLMRVILSIICLKDDL